LMSAIGGSMLDDETVEKLAGALMVVGSIVWSYIIHRKSEAAAKQARMEKVLSMYPASDRKPYGKNVR
jgi:hypothetical protein